MLILRKKRNKEELAPHAENRDKNNGDNSRCITHCNTTNIYDETLISKSIQYEHISTKDII